MQQNLLKPEEVKPEFWEQFFPKIVDARKKIEKFTISHEQYPEFMGHIAELAEKAGLKYVPHVMVQKIVPVGPPYMWHLPNAAASSGIRTIMINDTMMKITKSSLYSRLTPELETIIAHEFGHLQDGFLHLWSLKNVWKASPIVAMAGLYLYDKANEKTLHLENQSKDEHLKALEENLHKAADEEIAKIKNGKNDNGWNLDPKWQEGIMNAGRYSMAAAIGLVIGLGVTRGGVLAAEYRADRAAVQLTGKPEELKGMLSILTKIHNEFGKELNRIYKNMDKSQIKKSVLIKAHIQGAYDKLMMNTAHAHPDLADRVKNIDNFAERLQRINGFAEGRA